MPIIQSTYKPLDFTGERMVPEHTPANVFWEHFYRYRFATRFVKDKRVLDIACGEGYGTAALKNAGTASIIGIDVSQEACEHAQAKYGIDARIGQAENIPLPSQSVDVIVSFETIEHIERPEAFIAECVRLLVSGGILIISTPNREVHGEEGSGNPFHCSEMTEEEFVSLLSSRFSLQTYLLSYNRTISI